MAKHAPYSLKKALLNCMQASLSRGSLCTVGRERLRWWLKQGSKFPTLTSALYTWKFEEVNNLLNWLSMPCLNNPQQGYAGLEETQRRIKQAYGDVPPEKEARLCAAVAKVWKEVLGPPQTPESVLKSKIKDDHYFDGALKKWNW